ncbi:unnamed protein product [Callosobruchus maculatus]|uniref:Uncharacterized protein n=1 Tax=Callosobruchus maculatus TaxID=64391 RepID=A0A653CZA2_CALMS|nr:unnamed protein product [Callosobruchus maculatus]
MELIKNGRKALVPTAAIPQITPISSTVNDADEVTHDDITQQEIKYPGNISLSESETISADSSETLTALTNEWHRKIN